MHFKNNNRNCIHLVAVSSIRTVISCSCVRHSQAVGAVLDPPLLPPPPQNILRSMKRQASQAIRAAVHSSVPKYGFDKSPYSPTPMMMNRPVEKNVDYGLNCIVYI